LVVLLIFVVLIGVETALKRSHGQEPLAATVACKEKWVSVILVKSRCNNILLKIYLKWIDSNPSMDKTRSQESMGRARVSINTPSSLDLR
jgi:hypothetical protein